MEVINIGGTPVGVGQPCFIIGEIGINHNGDVGIAKRLIDVAKSCGCNMVKFQKRTPELCVPQAQRSVMRETPWGYITYMDYRYKVEFNEEQYKQIDDHCREQGMLWCASCWDNPSVDFIEKFNVPCYKVASATLTNHDLLKRTRDTGKPVLLSTGMSTLKEIDQAVEIVGKDNLIVLHSVSTYPAYYEELNLRAIATLRQRYNVPIGYSGHESGIASTVAAVALGACVVERHITLDRSMWGSDHAASLQPSGLGRLVHDIRLVETSMGTGEKKVLEREIPMITRLRRKD